MSGWSRSSFWLLALSLASVSLGALLPPTLSNARLDSRAFIVSTTGLNVSAPGTLYDNEPLGFYYDEGEIFLNGVPANGSSYAYSPYTDFNFAVDSNGNLISYGRSLCLANGRYGGDGANPNNTWQTLCGVASYYNYSNCAAVLPCPSSNSWGVYQGQYLTWGGGYDKWCILPNNYETAGFLTWVNSLGPPETGGNQYCPYRVRMLIIGYPAPSSLTTSTTSTTSTSTPPSVNPTTTTTTTTATTNTTTTTSPSTSTSTVKPTTSSIPPKTTTTTMTIPTTIVTTTSTPKPTSTPSSIPQTTMTNTTTPALPNPTVTSAVNTASSYISSAQSAYSSYMSNTTNTVLGTSAQNALETAVLYIANAKAIAIAQGVPEIATDLENVSSQLIEAAARAAIAIALLTAAAAAALTVAVDALDNLFSLAFSSAHDPAKDPMPRPTTTPTITSKPTSTSSTSSTTSSTPYACSFCIACDDAVLPGDTTGDGNSSDVTERSIDASIAGAGRGSFCGNNYAVPPYYSWSSSGSGNNYSPFYNYWETSSCSNIYNYDLVKATTQAGIAGQAPVGYQVSDPNTYVTEHIYEIQTINGFFVWALANGPPILRNQNLTSSCGEGLGSLLTTTPTEAWSTYPNFGYTTAPITQFFNQLDGAGGPSEFVYLEPKVNDVKAKLFSATMNPSLYTAYASAIPQATRILVAYQYLRDPTVSNIYTTVSRRIRNTWYNFGQACNTSTNANYNQYGGIIWTSLYDSWESQLLSGVANDIQIYATENLQSAIADIESTYYDNQEVPESEKLYWINQNVGLQAKIDEIDGTFNLNSLAANS